MPVYLDKRNNRYFIQFRLHGETYKERLPAKTTKKQAETLELKIKSQMLFEQFGIQTDRQDQTFERFIRDVYLPYVETNQSKDSFERAINICKDAMPFFKGKQMRSIRPADVEAFKTSRMRLLTQHRTVRKPATIARELSIVRGIFSMAVTNDLCEYNPVSRVKVARFDNVQNKVLAKEHETAFFAAFRSPWAADICKMVLSTGLRQNDILGLTKFDIDREAGLIRLVQGKTKRRVEIPMNETVQEIVDRHWKGKDVLLFPSPRTSKQAGSVRKAMFGACKRAKIPQLTIRDLRRTFGTRLHELGYDDSTVAQLLGHSDMRSIHRYKRGTEIKKQAVFSLDDAPILPDAKKRFG